jgi:hypothetical protein
MNIVAFDKAVHKTVIVHQSIIKVEEKKDAN